ncbi:branched-chain amino acid ABC transporter permease [Salmonella enterica subsp. enterica serovar Choleraesuis]|nr:branched-chain amino acid ABC transporter permease [Salmonella enterica subsp. enterica serovar Choleraesuis]
MPRFSSLNSALIKAIFLICLADGIVAVSYGSLALSYGFPFWVPLTLAITVLAGASEFMFVGIVASGGSPLAGAAAGLLVNARHLPFGIAVRDLVGKRAAALLGCHIMNDESVAFGISQSTHEQRKAAFWLCGLGIALFWPLGVIIGGFLGQIIPSQEVIGLDAVFPAVMFALVLPMLKNRLTRNRSLAGAGIALASTPFVAAGLPVLLALFGLIVKGKKND